MSFGIQRSLYSENHKDPKRNGDPSQYYSIEMIQLKILREKAKLKRYFIVTYFDLRGQLKGDYQ